MLTETVKTDLLVGGPQVHLEDPLEILLGLDPTQKHLDPNKTDLLQQGHHFLLPPGHLRLDASLQLRRQPLLL